eukprot:GHVT01078593.1.p2 GENE.GHVT01078593.1~~GHVT01078593.1.p2  ORF type:complete len:107 (+),score=5.02 GHVT01078593.1:465-785(+)
MQKHSNTTSVCTLLAARGSRNRKGDMTGWLELQRCFEAGRNCARQGTRRLAGPQLHQCHQPTGRCIAKHDCSRSSKTVVTSPSLSFVALSPINLLVACTGSFPQPS